MWYMSCIFRCPPHSTALCLESKDKAAEATAVASVELVSCPRRLSCPSPSPAELKAAPANAAATTAAAAAAAADEGAGASGTASPLPPAAAAAAAAAVRRCSR